MQNHIRFAASIIQGLYGIPLKLTYSKIKRLTLRSNLDQFSNEKVLAKYLLGVNAEKVIGIMCS